MKMNFDKALEYAKNCRIDNHSDWRVPSIKEWLAILSYKYEDIDISIFNFNASYYWSSTIYTNNPNHAWCVSFSYGDICLYGKGSSFYVRCIRGGQYNKLGNLIIHNLQDDEEPFTVKQNTVIDNRTSLEWTICE